jgi:hypothetical protein
MKSVRYLECGGMSAAVKDGGGILGRKMREASNEVCLIAYCIACAVFG